MTVKEPVLGEPIFPEEGLDAVDPEVIPVEDLDVKYPNFTTFTDEAKFHIVTDELILNCNRVEAQLLMEQLGIPWDEYITVTEHPDYIRTMHDKSARQNLVPYIPAIYNKMGQKASEGDVAMTKLVLQHGNEVGPDSLTLVKNDYLLNMTDDELAREIDNVKQKLLELGSDDDS